MVHSFSNENRLESIQRLKENVLDVLVIGGGATGAGIALDAAVRGLKTGLVDMQDFGSGSSSSWSSLFHSEVRQAHQLDMKWHGECIRERLVLQENAPHLMKQIPLLLPSYRVGLLGKHSFGSKLIERISEMARREKRKTIAKKELVQLAPILSDKAIKGATVYREFWRDETRLTFDLLKEAARKGVTALNYLKVESFLYEGGQAKGVLAIDQLSGEVYKLFAKKIVNASGSWIESLREQDRSKNAKSIDYATDSYFTVTKQKLPIDHVIYIEMTDRKLLSLTPRGEKVIVALTKGDRGKKTDTDIDDMILTLNQSLRDVEFTRNDIESRWEVHRPIVVEISKNKRDSSRKNDWFVSESGLFTVVCGHLTSYRLTAEQVLDRICKQLDISAGCETDTLTLSGGYVGGANDFSEYKKKRVEEGQQYGIDVTESEPLVERYGSNIGQIYARVWTYKKQALLFGLPETVFAELLYCIEEEMAATPTDFLIRRTGYLYLNKPLAMQIKEPVFRYMRDRFSWSEEQEEKYRDELEKEMARAYKQ